MVRVAVSLLASCALASEEVAFADEALSLLQRSTKHVSVLQPSNDNVAVVDDSIPYAEPFSATSLCGDCAEWPIKPKPQFGPDGTWAHPYCKDIQGCVPYCPAGCDGVAKWDWWTFPNSNFAVGGLSKHIYPRNQVNFAYCLPGERKGGTPIGTLIPGNSGFMNCLGSENASKPTFWSQNGAVDKMPYPNYATNGQVYPRFPFPWLKQMEKYHLTAYGHEYCPAGCENDCAYFKFGNFLQCGVTGMKWNGYNNEWAPGSGPNKNCREGIVQGRTLTSYHWCGATTTTTTTTLTTTPPFDDGIAGDIPTTTTQPVEVTSPPADDAQAVGDPHIRAINNGKSEIY